MKRQLKETLKRFNKILKYDVSGKKLIKEQEGPFKYIWDDVTSSDPTPDQIKKHRETKVDNTSIIIGEIIDIIEPDLPLDKYSNAVESIILLQKTLVDLDKLNKTYGIDVDGVDGDFGTDTSSALYNTIKSKELTADNIDQFEVVLEDSKEKLVNTLENYEEFIEKYKDQAGVSIAYLETCKTDSNFPDLNFVIKRKQCHFIKDIANTLTEVFPEESDINKAAILSVMMKEQGKGKYICAPNNNYAGIQTDAGSWGALDNKIDNQFCAKDAERVRAFASFEKLKNGLSFIKQSFDKKEWFISLLKDVSDKEVETVDFNVEEVSKQHAKIWQTKWNLSLSDDQFNNFESYGYNPNLKNKTFSDKKGVYNKNIEDFSKEELELHNNNKVHFRSPDKIKKSLEAVSSYFKKAYKYFIPTNIIKLKEQDIHRIIKRVLNEQQVKPKYERGVSDIMELVRKMVDRLDDIQYEEKKEKKDQDVVELRRLYNGQDRTEKLLLTIEKELGIPAGSTIQNMIEDVNKGKGSRLPLTLKFLRDWEEKKG